MSKQQFWCRSGLSALMLALAACGGGGTGPTGPKLVSRVPAPDATGVSVLPAIAATFDSALDPTSGQVQLYVGSQPAQVGSTAVTAASTVTLQVMAPLQHDTEYRVRVNVADNGGIALASPVEWSFRTALPLLAPLSLIEINAFAHPSAVAVADVTGDGRADYVVATIPGPKSLQNLWLLPQQADGSLGVPVAVPAHRGLCTSLSLATGDIDGDGLVDVVVGHATCGFEVLLQAPGGGFLSSSAVPTEDAHRVRVADLDGDGRLDVVGVGEGHVSIWHNTASGLSSTPQVLTLPGVLADPDLALGDINGDGRIDIVVSFGFAEVSRSLVLIRQRADGSFEDPEYRQAAAGGTARNVVIGDIDGDGRQDVVFASLAFGSNGIGVMRQAADGTLGPVEQIPTVAAVDWVKVADVDGDGRVDVILVYSNLGYVGLMRQMTDGRLAAEDAYPALGAASEAIAVGDVNGDGRLDLIVEDQLLLGRGP